MDSLVVPANLDSLSVIRDALMAKARSAGLTDDDAYKLALAVDEIATNIILHGYQENNLSGDVTAIFDVTGTEFVVTLEDAAPAYDPRAHKLPSEEDLSKPLEDREIGGLGVFLAFQVDRMDYEYKENRNRNIFAMKLGGKKS